MMTKETRKMNRVLTKYIILAVALLMGSAATAQSSGVVVEGNVFGGGNQANVKGSSSVTVKQTGTDVNGLLPPTIEGDVYGGGALASVNVTATVDSETETTTYSQTPGTTTTVEITHGTINGNVYGGGLGESIGYGGTENIAALVYGKVYVNIGTEPSPGSPVGNATINGSVFGCNNINGTPLDDVFVDVYKTFHAENNRYPDTIGAGNTIEYMDKLRAALISDNADANYAIKAVYGGGNKASYKPNGEKTTTVHVHYCDENTIKTVYGGGNAADVGWSGHPAHTHLIIDGGRFDQVFGGGNGFSSTNNHDDPTAANYNPGANIFGSATTDINGGLYNQVFGGSNQYGNIASASLNINGTSGCVEMILESFCGGNEANMTGGDIDATIDNCDIRIGTLYGGSNNADILKDGSGNGGNVTLNVLGGNFDYVFGGSKGTSADPADIQGNVTLNLHGGTISSAYGGSDVKGNIFGDIAVNVLDTVTTCPLQVDTVYGAGRDAYYTPTNSNAVSPIVKIQHATIGHGSGNTAVPGCVFGGGKGSTAIVTAHPKVIVGELTTINDPHGVAINTLATVTGDVYGGGDAANVVGGTTVLVQKCNSSAKYVYGGGNAAHVDSTKVYVTGGTIDTIFGGGHGSLSPSVAANVFGNDTISITGGTIGKVFSGSNLNGSIGGRMALNIAKSSAVGACDMKIGEAYGGGNQAAGKAGTITIGCTGTWTTTGEHNHTNHNSTDNRIGYELEGIGTVYGGGNMADIGTNENHSNIHLIIQNGIVENVFGGNNTSGTIYGTIQVDIDSVGDCSPNWYVGNVYGGGNLAAYTGSPNVNILRGTVSQNVFGGGKGSTAVVTGTPSVTVGDLAVGHEAYKATVLGDVYGGGDAANVATGTPMVLVQKCNSKVGNDVYGGGNAADVPATNVTVTGGTISGSVFGGGHGDKDATPTPLEANVAGNTSVLINGGVINQVFGGSNSKGTIGGAISVVVNKVGTCDMHITEVYGGGNYASSNAGTVDIQCTGADDMIDYVYGGANQADIGTSGSPSNITLNITGGRIDNVFGGNNNSGTIHGTITVNVEWDGSCANNYLGNVFGGGNLAAYTGSPEVNIKNGTVSGSVYGGGMGSSAVVTGAPQVTVGDLTSGHDDYEATVMGDVYGGGDAANVNIGTPEVLIQKCNTSVGYVYGGGNAANVPATSVTVTGGTIENVFGGGHGDKDAEPALEANVTGNTSVTINGGTITKVFGGSNSKGTIGGSIGVVVNKTSTCAMHITEVYGGGNFAASNAGNITVNCTGTFTDWNNYEGIKYLYGGANQADVTGPITLNITQGTIENVFGGNNTSGTISNGITVNVTKADDCMHLYNVYGAGNLADYSGSPAVNIKHGTVDNNVFGGGKGSTAIVTGNPVVTIGDNNAGHVAVVSGDVYGGGDAAAVTGTTTVAYNDNNASSTVGNLFGGGNAAGVSSTATVTLTSGKVVSGIYGGCNSSGDIGGKITVNVKGGTVGALTDVGTLANVFGGGYGASTTTSGNVEVNVTNGTINGDVYGGSALGNVNAGSGNTTIVNVTGGTLNTIETTPGGFSIYNGGNVYGGGLGRKAVADDPATPDEDESQPAIEAKVYGTVTVNIGSYTPDSADPDQGDHTGNAYSGNATIQGNVYGCNNTYGSPQEDVTVNIYQTAHTTTDDVDYVEDDGVNGPPTFAINNVFGGGNEADFRVNKTTTVNVFGCDNTIERTFGGGNAAATNSVITDIKGGRIHDVFGGGNGEVSAADIYGNITLGIHGGTIGQSYSISNQNGVVTDGASVVIDNAGCGGVEVEEHFMGGNFANVYGDLNSVITCEGGMVVKNLYGGCKQADVLKYPSVEEVEAHHYDGTYPDYVIELYDANPTTYASTYAEKFGNVHLTVNGGTYENVYGGSQGTPERGANIEGDVQLDIYGGTITKAIFGGSHIKGSIGGKIVVTVDYDPTNQCALDVSKADVYGGGNQADYTAPYVSGSSGPRQDYPVVNIKRATVNNVFGGGLEADVTGNPRVAIWKYAKVLGNVYGGGNQGEVTGNPKVIVNGEKAGKLE